MVDSDALNVATKVAAWNRCHAARLAGSATIPSTPTAPKALAL
jgi:hypothetical protein